MTARTATVRLYVAAAGFITAVVSFLGAVVLLATSIAAWAAAVIHARAEARAPRPAAVGRALASEVTRTPGGTRMPLRLVPSETGAPAVRLTAALTGLGFRAPDVRRFVSSLGDRVEREPIEALIRDGLRALASPATASL